jgi:hypothetical protein
MRLSPQHELRLLDQTLALRLRCAASAARARLRQAVSPSPPHPVLLFTGAQILPGALTNERESQAYGDSRSQNRRTAIGDEWQGHAFGGHEVAFDQSPDFSTSEFFTEPFWHQAYQSNQPALYDRLP